MFYEYTVHGAPEVIDGSTARADVGRIYDNGKWVLIQPSAGVDHAEYLNPNGEIIDWFISD